MTSKTAAPAIYGAMNQVMKAIGMVGIGKDQKNVQQKFSFRGIDQVYNSLQQHMVEAGIFTTSEVLDQHREERATKSGGVLAFTTITMRYTFHASDGSTVTSTVVGEGMDSGDKSSPKAMAIAHKYALLQCFMVPTDAATDPDYEIHEPAPRQEPEPVAAGSDTLKELGERANEAGIALERIAASYRVASVADLTEPQARNAINRLKAQVADNQEKAA